MQQADVGLVLYLFLFSAILFSIAFYFRQYRTKSSDVLCAALPLQLQYIFLKHQHRIALIIRLYNFGMSVGIAENSFCKPLLKIADKL